jgi:hypothetical protein
MCGKFSFHTYQKLKKLLKLLEEKQPVNLSDMLAPYPKNDLIFTELKNISKKEATLF